MTFSDPKSRFTKRGVASAQQTLAHLGIASVLVLVILGGLFWKRGANRQVHYELSGVLPLSAPESGTRQQGTEALASLVDTDLKEIPSRLEGAGIRILFKQTSPLKEGWQLNAALFLFVILFFIGMGAFIFLRSGHLIRTQRLAIKIASSSLAQRTAELALAESELASHKRVLRVVLDRVGEAVVLFSAKGTCVFQNEAAKALFPPIEHSTDLDTWENAVVLYDSESSLPLARAEMPLRVALRGEVFCSRLMETRNSEGGELAFVVVSAYPLTEEAGQIRGAVACFKDVTENIQTEMALRKAMSVAEDASRSKTEFLANISHEIRTPMATILGYVDILLRPSIRREDVRQHVKTIRRNGQVLMTLIDDILDVSRIESGRLNIEKTHILLEEAISEVHSLLSSRADEKGIDFTVRIEGKVPKRIFTADVRLRQILINLVGNAIKFTEKGGVEIVVSFERDSSTEKNLLRFLVSDTGCGIPSHRIENLFSPFVQVDTKANRLYGGSGLGLTLSRRLALALGGDVRLASTKVGVGSRFLIEIDPGVVDTTDLTNDISIESASFSRLHEDETVEGEVLRGVKLLLVDDSSDNLALFSNFLSVAGAIVTQAKDGQSALNYIPGGQFDLVLLDIQMPRMDGYQTIAKIRKLGYQGPVVALTAHAMESESVTCKAAGFDDFLNKPIGEFALVRCVRRFVTSFEGKTPPEVLPFASPFRPRSQATSDKVRKIISLFVKNIPSELQSIKAACDDQNWDEVVKNTHRLRGTAGSCGFMELMDDISDFEEAVLAGNTEEAFISQWIEKLESVGASSAREFKMAKVVGS